MENYESKTVHYMVDFTVLLGNGHLVNFKDIDFICIACLGPNILEKIICAPVAKSLCPKVCAPLLYSICSCHIAVCIISYCNLYLRFF